MIKSLGLKGAKNARDAGCIPGIRKGRLIRSGNTASLTKKDTEYLEAYGVTLVIDLRTQAEVTEKPDVKIPGARYMHIPLLDEKTAGITHEKSNDVYERIPDILNIYRGFVTEYTAAQLKKAVTAFAECEGCVLIHCTEGKDRAGILTALLLYTAGADAKDIYEDYLFTNKVGKRRAKKYYWFVRIFRKSKRAAEKVRLVYLADRRYIESMLDEITSRYGNLDEYIENEIGIDAELKALIRNKLRKG